MDGPAVTAYALCNLLILGMLNGFISPPPEAEEGEWVHASEYLHQQLILALS